MMDLFVYKSHSKGKAKYMMGSLKRKKCVNVMVLLQVYNPNHCLELSITTEGKMLNTFVLYHKRTNLVIIEISCNCL